MQYVFYGFKFLYYTVLGGAIGYLIGDEIQNRMQRAHLRQLCYIQQADELPDSPNEMQDAVIQYRCRNAIP